MIENEKANLLHPPSHYHLPSSGQYRSGALMALSLLLSGAGLATREAAGVAIVGVAGASGGAAGDAGTKLGPNSTSTALLPFQKNKVVVVAGVVTVVNGVVSIVAGVVTVIAGVFDVASFLHLVPHLLHQSLGESA